MTTHPPRSGTRIHQFAAGLFILAIAPSVTQAQLFSYEGFNNPSLSAVPGVSAPNATTLNAVATSGFGWTGTWTVSNGNSNDSVYLTSGLSFPASYPGSFTAVGGSAVNKGNTANSMLRLNFDPAVAASVNSGVPIYVSFLGRRQGDLTPDTGVSELQAPGTFGNPYPRNAGVRFPSLAATNNNTSLGLFGSNGNAAANAGWGAWGFNDVNGLSSGAPFTAEADFIVVEFMPSISRVTVWVNPQEDGSSDGKVSFIHTNGGNPRPFTLYAFGVEAGGLSGDRAAGEWAFDEIRIAGSFEDAAGFTMIPEPSTYALIFGVLVLGIAAVRRNRRSTAS